jgi:DNA-binding FrmR family transcriptional regulator
LVKTAVKRGLRHKQDLQNRLRNAKGHMRAVEKMIADDAPCTEVLCQLLAVRGAMCAIRRELWRAYLLSEDCDLHSNDAVRRVRAWRELRESLVGASRS